MSIPIYETVLWLAYSGAADRLLQSFPEAVLEDEWLEVAEYQQLECLLEQSETDATIGSTMLRQLRSKQLSHGRTVAFRLATSEAAPICGTFNRWGFTFTSEEAFGEATRLRIVVFLQSFGIGTMECYTIPDSDTPPR
ncbi:hypothetical protein FEM03_12420 [Phragmitibacter flavus]|uniref:Uncharacterized protein n=1 Tax=Phragmitibacter flavus TaxID=2576071 RepID=A0A5R8KE05_9BACT|nr:hypothetical protein [Phragmitibacter flavus]TLD70523.1 hypothetical protein FEM03_12420 [Phragmitibacter flavus]